MDFLKSAVASAISKGPLGGYIFADRVDLNNSVWTLHNATKRDGDIRCSILTYDISANRSRLPIAKNAVRKSRTLHHPGVVKVLDTIETDSHIYLITERITPLEWFTRRKSLTEETIKWGLWSVATVVRFINKDAHSIHGNVRASSVFVGDAGEWKLGGFDILSDMNDDDAVIFKYSSLVPDLGRYLPPEVVNSGWDSVKRAPLPAVDSYGYGTLIVEAFSGSFSNENPESQARGVPPSMQQQFKGLMKPNPKIRNTVSNFLEFGRRNGGFFQTPLINISENVDNLGLKSENEKAEFLSDLNEVSDQFPEDYLKRKILPELIKSVEYGGGGPPVFAVVLQIGTKLSSDEYESLLTPVLVRLFASPDRALRVCLLDNLSLMIDHLSQKIVTDKLFPNMVTGFTDTAPVVREQTVKAVLIIVSKLSDRIINGELLKYLAKTANDEQPGIRTNTTICLGKLAKYLSNSTRTKILVAAFTRSLKDPFVHARNAALMALAATGDSFTEEDCANKILPAICPSLLDKEKIIRDQANKTLDLYLQRIRKHAQTLPETALQHTNSSTSISSSSASAPRIGTPANDSTWAGWAISSFTNKLAAASGEIQPKNPQNSGPLSSFSSRPSSALANNRTNSNGTSSPPVSIRDIRPTRTVSQPQEEDDDAWGSMEDSVAQAEAQEDELASRFAEDSSQAFSAAAATATNGRTSHNEDPNAEPDFAGWLAAKKIQGKAGQKQNLPKGLGPKTPPARDQAGKKLTVSSNGPAGRPSTVGGSTTMAARKAAATAIAKNSSTSPTTMKTAKLAVDEEETDDAWGDAWE